MKINILVNGAFGKMGTLACQAIEQTNDLSLISKVGREDDLAMHIKQRQPDLVLDLTNSKAIWQTANITLDLNTRLVIGTSGLSTDQIESLTNKAKEKSLGSMIVPNFSIGAVLMMKYAADAAHYFKHATIKETHHPAKLDSPSGTALATARKISEALQVDENKIDIQSSRKEGVLAKQQVIFTGQSETLTIEHDTKNREVFMPGVLLACRKVMAFDQMHVGLEWCLS